MCAATALIETGAVELVEPETRVVFDTAAGRVTATAECADDRLSRLRVAMPLVFVERRDALLRTDEFGSVPFDVCFGGMFFAIVRAADVGLEIAPDNAEKLARAGVRLRHQIAQEVSVQHPCIADLDELTHVMFVDEAENGAMLTCTTMRPGRVDRSACGTGSAALAALRVSQGINDARRCTAHALDYRQRAGVLIFVHILTNLPVHRRLTAAALVHDEESRFTSS